MHAETSADFADKEGSDDDFVTTYKTKRPSYMKSVKCIDPAQLESRISANEDAIKDWRRHKRDKEELQKELASCKDTIKTMETELSLKRRKLADANTVINTIQENMRCLVCKSFPGGDCVIFPCCKQFGTCYTCIHEWLLESPSCPHCRAPMDVDSCTRIPEAIQLRPMFSALQAFQRNDEDVIEV